MSNSLTDTELVFIAISTGLKKSPGYWSPQFEPNSSSNHQKLHWSNLNFNFNHWLSLAGTPYPHQHFQYSEFLDLSLPFVFLLFFYIPESWVPTDVVQMKYEYYLWPQVLEQRRNGQLKVRLSYFTKISRSTQNARLAYFRPNYYSLLLHISGRGLNLVFLGHVHNSVFMGFICHFCGYTSLQLFIFSLIFYFFFFFLYLSLLVHFHQVTLNRELNKKIFKKYYKSYGLKTHTNKQKQFIQNDCSKVSKMP